LRCGLTVIQKPSFRRGDDVYLIVSETEMLGPYKVAFVHSTSRTYDLSTSDGESVNNGTGVAEKDLVLVKNKS
jgi:hypothetical protein